MSFVTDDAVFLAPRQAPVRGKNQVRDLFVLVFSRFALEQDFALEEIQSIRSTFQVQLN